MSSGKDLVGWVSSGGLMRMNLGVRKGVGEVGDAGRREVRHGLGSSDELSGTRKSSKVNDEAGRAQSVCLLLVLWR